MTPDGGVLIYGVGEDEPHDPTLDAAAVQAGRREARRELDPLVSLTPEEQAVISEGADPTS